MKNFQVITLIFFGLLAGIAVAIFSGAIPISKKSTTSFGATGRIVMWGTLPQSELKDTLAFFNTQIGDLTLTYIEKNPATYSKDLLESFAFNTAPDIFIMSQDLIDYYEDKVVIIPYQSFTERMFSDSYIQSASVFKSDFGILGFPLLSDPLVMFYNKNDFDSAGITSAPTSWSQFSTIVPLLTQKNQVLEIRKSAVALGEAQNVRNFKEILLAMNLQLGNNIVVRNYQKMLYEPVFNARSTISAKPAEETLRFFMEFSNPLRNVYSWNKSMPSSMLAFIAEDLSIYFGFASEANLIKKMNPNLNFDMALLPQVEGSNTPITFANVYALAITKTTKNFQGAYIVASQLANGPIASAVSYVTSMAPVRRDLLSPSFAVVPFSDIYYRAALQSRSWVDPDKNATNQVFSNMIENTISGLRSFDQAVGDTQTELKILLNRQ